MATPIVPIWMNAAFSNSESIFHVDSTGIGVDISFVKGKAVPIVLKQTAEFACNATFPCLPLRLPSEKKSRLEARNLAVYATNQMKKLLTIEAGSSSSARLTLIEPNEESSQLSEISNRYIRLSAHNTSAIQFQSTRVSDDISCLFRSEDKTFIYTIEDNIENVICVAEINTNGSKYASLNPYIFAELLVLNKDGSTSVINAECDPNLQGSIAAIEGDNPTQVSCGAFIRSAVTLSQQQVVFLDFVSGKRQKICSTCDQRFVDGEQLLLVQINACNCLQYFVASTHHLSVWDQRFAIEPVMIWRHQLNNDPSDLSVVGKTTNDGYALVQSFNETSIVNFAHSELNKTQVISRCQPFAAGVPSDFIRYYGDVATEFEGLQEVVKRCDSGLSGVAGVCIDDRLIVFQSSKSGDLFYQPFRNEMDSDFEAYNYGLGATRLPSDEIYDLTEKWIAAAAKTATVSSSEQLLRCLEMVDVTDFKNMIIANSIDCLACTTDNNEAENKSLSGRFCRVSSDEILKIVRCFRERGVLKADSTDDVPLDYDIRAAIEQSDLMYGKYLFLNILDKVEAAETDKSEDCCSLIELDKLHLETSLDSVLGCFQSTPLTDTPPFRIPLSSAGSHSKRKKRRRSSIPGF